MRVLFPFWVLIFPFWLSGQGVETGRALGYVRNGEFEKAIPVYKSLLGKDRDMKNSEAISGLAWACFQAGEYDAAAIWYNRASKLSPVDTFSLFMHAKSLLFGRRYSESKAAFRNLLLIDESHSGWHFWLSMCDTLSHHSTSTSGKPAISILTINNHDNAGGTTVWQGDKLVFSSRSGTETALVYSPMRREGKYIDFYQSRIIAAPQTGFVECYPSFQPNNGKLWFTRIASGGDSVPAVAEGKGSGIFSGNPRNSEWADLVPFPYNSNAYNVRQPAPALDGSFLIFASDMPGGYGGYDLWISAYTDHWQTPVNLGPVINTSGNELTPVLSEDQQLLYFASDGHAGLGKLDLFSVSRNENSWINLVHLPFPLNSEYNDHSYSPRGNGNEGFFSSDRIGGYGGEDIFLFEYPFQRKPCLFQQNNTVCITLQEDYESSHSQAEFDYEWDMGDGFSVTGNPARYCFIKPGYYQIVLKLNEKILGENNELLAELKTDISRKLAITPPNQAWIENTEIDLINNDIDFDASLSRLEECEVASWRWEFGDGALGFGPKVKHSYNRPGEYEVRLTITGIKNDLSGTKTACTYKRILVSGR